MTYANLTGNEMGAARQLVLLPKLDPQTGDQNADYYGSFEVNYSSPNHVFWFYGIAGATYDVFSISWFDPVNTSIHSSSGQFLAGPSFFLDINGIDSVDDFKAPYTGIYYVDADWSQGLYYNNAYVSVSETLPDPLTDWPAARGVNPTTLPVSFRVMAPGTLGPDSIDGGGGNDRLVGFYGSDTIRGLDGDDKIYGGGGSDDLNGNLGNDIVNGMEGADFVRGGQGDDFVFGNEGDDWHVNGNLGNDNVFGDQGNDWLFGGPGFDRLQGGPGNDTLSGDLGNDSLYGGTVSKSEGADRFVFGDLSGQDTIFDFSGAEGDRIQVSAFVNGTDIDGVEDLIARLVQEPAGIRIDLGDFNHIYLANVGLSGIWPELFVVV